MSTIAKCNECGELEPDMVRVKTESGKWGYVHLQDVWSQPLPDYHICRKCLIKLLEASS